MTLKQIEAMVKGLDLFEEVYISANSVEFTSYEVRNNGKKGRVYKHRREANDELRTVGLFIKDFAQDSHGYWGSIGEIE